MGLDQILEVLDSSLHVADLLLLFLLFFLKSKLHSIHLSHRLLVLLVNSCILVVDPQDQPLLLKHLLPDFFTLLINLISRESILDDLVLYLSLLFLESENAVGPIVNYVLHMVDEFVPIWPLFQLSS